MLSTSLGPPTRANQIGFAPWASAACLSCLDRYMPLWCFGPDCRLPAAGVGGHPGLLPGQCIRGGRSHPAGEQAASLRRRTAPSWQ